MNERRKFDLEERLIDFAVNMIAIVEALPASKAGKHVAGQLIRSGTAPAPNYGEAQIAESRRDFIHKLKISLKELRESMIWLKIIERKPMCEREQTKPLIEECNQLVAIFVKSIQTARDNEDN